MDCMRGRGKSDVKPKGEEVRMGKASSTRAQFRRHQCGASARHPCCRWLHPPVPFRIPNGFRAFARSRVYVIWCVSLRMAELPLS